MSAEDDRTVSCPYCLRMFYHEDECAEHMMVDCEAAAQASAENEGIQLSPKSGTPSRGPLPGGHSR